MTYKERKAFEEEVNKRVDKILSYGTLSAYVDSKYTMRLDQSGEETDNSIELAYEFQMAEEIRKDKVFFMKFDWANQFMNRKE